MKRFLKFRYGQGGFTLIELLIVVAILGILAAVIIPNAAGFMITGTLNAANTEVANVKTAAIGYMAENGEWPTLGWATGPLATTDYLEPYLSGTLKGSYKFSDGSGAGEGDPSGGHTDTAGEIRLADEGAWGTGDIVFYPDTQMWERPRSE